MRILFVSGVAVGGSARSTRDLAVRLAAHGHAVGVLFGVEGAPARRRLHKRATNLAVKLKTSPLRPPVDGAASLVGRRPRRPDTTQPIEVWESVLPQNAFPTVFRSFRPDVVVASSLERLAWRRIRTILASHKVPSVLYVREQNGFGHLTVSHAPPDLLLANAEAHTERARSLGYAAVTVPSVVGTEACRVDSTRERVLFVNPVEISGMEIALRLAAARPDVAFAFAESWPLDDAARADLEGRLAPLPNVELRAFTSDPRVLYGDARLLLAPYLTNGRPRVVLEAQSNGIPVLASSVPALHEAVGPGGLVVDADAPVDDWAAALAEILDDPGRYGAFAAAALRHAERDEVRPDLIVARFEEALTGLVGSHPGEHSDAG